MAINIHFLRHNDLEKIDYTKVFEFFEAIPKFKIFYSNENVEIVYEDEDFEFSYRYLITRRNRLNGIYKLNPSFSNINFSLELPVAIPTFLAKEILSTTQKFCKMFDLSIYHDSFEDVRGFNLVDVLVLFEETRKAYIEEYGLQDKIYMDHNKLTEVCTYQRKVHGLREYYHNEYDTPLIRPIMDNITLQNGISCVWKVGKACVFPPHLDYIYVYDEDETTFLIPRSEFDSIIGEKYLCKLQNYLPDMFIIKPKEAKKAKKLIGKLRKASIIEHNFIPRRLCDYVDR